LLPVAEVGSGHTIAAVGLKDTFTGDTLVAYKVGIGIYMMMMMMMMMMKG